VILLEKNSRIGIKILISGGGKCNITHDGPIEDLLDAFRPNEARFIRPACYRFTNRQILDMLTSRGLEVYTRPDGRVFPVNGTAKDVVAILKSYLDDAGVDVRLDCPATGLIAPGGRVVGVATQAETIESDLAVVCVGGSSYPGAGTTGDGWPWVEALGHKIVPVRPALAPIVTDPRPPESRAGVALRDCVLKARQKGKEVARWRGDLLFTHHGVSGPTVLGISRMVAEKKLDGKVTLEADVCPDLGFEPVGEAVQLYCATNPKRPMSPFAEQFVAKSLAADIVREAGIEEGKPAGQVDRKSRNRLVEILKGWQLGEARHVPLEKGEVVAGGVSLDEVDPQTMKSKRIEGLYLCGEILDIAGPVGGYNLQAAFATGYVAGESVVGPENHGRT
jgi:hypothetical protein